MTRKGPRCQRFATVLLIGGALALPAADVIWPVPALAQGSPWGFGHDAAPVLLAGQERPALRS